MFVNLRARMPKTAAILIWSCLENSTYLNLFEAYKKKIKKIFIDRQWLKLQQQLLLMVPVLLMYVIKKI